MERCKCEMQVTLWTVGHSHRDKDSFLKILSTYGIQIVVDVRSFPTSKIEHFKKEQLEKWLQSWGIEYLWLGKELGGYRKGGYKRHMKTKLFREGIRRLLDVASQKRTCIMCMEANPKFCHRRFIAEYLSRKGVEVIHIITKGQENLRKFINSKDLNVLRWNLEES